MREAGAGAPACMQSKSRQKCFGLGKASALLFMLGSRAKHDEHTLMSTCVMVQPTTRAAAGQWPQRAALLARHEAHLWADTSPPRLPCCYVVVCLAGQSQLQGVRVNQAHLQASAVAHYWAKSALPATSISCM